MSPTDKWSPAYIHYLKTKMTYGNIHYDPSVINKNYRKDFKEKYGENYINFSQRCQKNPFMRTIVIGANHFECAFCHVPFKDTDKIILHHTDYDCTCIYSPDECIRFPHPTPKRPDKTILVPDCEKCYHEHYDNFLKCFLCLEPVHQDCHEIIHGHMKPKHPYLKDVPFKKVSN